MDILKRMGRYLIATLIKGLEGLLLTIFARSILK